jgi:hypothetical protein
MVQDVHVPSVARGGIGSSSHAPIGSRGISTEDEEEDEVKDEDDNHEDMDQGYEELGPSQLEDAPLT